MQETDLKIIDKLTTDLYQCICFEIGDKPPVENLRKLFLPSAKMIRNNENSPEIMTVDEFIETFQARTADGTIKSFYEGEIKQITEIFGKIAHRFSTYETKFDLTKADPFAVGINSIQYINVDGEWKISSIVWNNQTEELTIPNKYLP